MQEVPVDESPVPLQLARQCGFLFRSFIKIALVFDLENLGPQELETHIVLVRHRIDSVGCNQPRRDLQAPLRVSGSTKVCETDQTYKSVERCG